MRTYSLISSSLYSYPISLCLALLVLSVLSSRNAGGISRNLTLGRCKVVFPVLWYLQLCICLSFVSTNSARLSSAISLDREPSTGSDIYIQLISIGIAIRALFTAQIEYDDERLIEPYLVSHTFGSIEIMPKVQLRNRPHASECFCISWRGLLLIRMGLTQSAGPTLTHGFLLWFMN